MPIEQKRTSLAESASAFGNIGCRHVDEMNVDGFRFAAELLYAEIGQNFGQLADFSVVTDGFHLNQRADGSESSVWVAFVSALVSMVINGIIFSPF